MPFGLQTKSLVVGGLVAVFVVPIVVSKLSSRKGK